MKQETTIKQDIRKIKQSKQFLTIFILLFVVLLFWIIISLVSSQTATKIDPELQLFAKPLTPVIDTEIFNGISAKKEYTAEELAGFTIFKVLTSRDGRTERIVPIEVTADDLEPLDNDASQSNQSLLEEAVSEEENLEETETNSQETQLSPDQNQSDEPFSDSPSQQESSDSNNSGLESQL